MVVAREVLHLSWARYCAVYVFEFVTASIVRYQFRIMALA